MRNRLSLVWPSRFTPPPLVDEATIQLIYRVAHSPSTSNLIAQREAQHMLLGDRLSTFAGRGDEFAENQPYVPGDEARFINWRVLARSGQLYRKTFYEERRPPVWLVMDRGASMRFGTRTRLKVSLAAQLALFHLFLAQRHGLLTAAVIRDKKTVWYSPTQQRGEQQRQVQQICVACPPLSEAVKLLPLATILKQCQLQLEPGCIVIIYSDFLDLQKNDLPLLHTLAQRHTVYARHITDISEEKLPAQGKFQLVQGDEMITVDCNDPILKSRYQLIQQQRNDTLAEWFLQAGIEYQRYRADESLFAQD